MQGVPFEASSSSGLSGQSATRLAIWLPEDLARQLGLLEGKAPRRTMAELLGQSDYSWSLTSEAREWIDAPRAGDELL